MLGTIGEIRLFGGSWAPTNWAVCQGQLLSIQQYQALYAVISNQYGGDGTTNFALPDLRGRVVVHPGNREGLSYAAGQHGGTESVTLTEPQLPDHSHNPRASAQEGVTAEPTAGFPAEQSNEVFAATNPILMGPSTSAGGGQGHNNMMPFLVCNYIICLLGTFPDRP